MKPIKENFDVQFEDDIQLDTDRLGNLNTDRILIENRRNSKIELPRVRVNEEINSIMEIDH